MDLAGNTATSGMMTIHWENAAGGYVCNHFPPVPQIEEGDDITEDAFCKEYIRAFSEKNGVHIPEAAVNLLVSSGKIKEMLLQGGYANQFIDDNGCTVLYQIAYDKELVCKCVERWLEQMQKFWSRIRVRFDANKMPNRVIMLSDIPFAMRSHPQYDRSLRRIFGEEDQRSVPVHYSSDEDILRGALAYKNRLNRKLPTWTEYLPNLKLEVIKDGDYAELELIGDNVSFDVMGDNNEHVVEEKLVLKANEKEFSFPLLKQDISRKATMIDAYVTDKSFPLDHDVEVALSVRYRYGFDNSYELLLRPMDSNETAFKEIIVEWANADQRENIPNIWPPEINRLPDHVVLNFIDITKERLLKIQDGVEKHMVDYVRGYDKSYQIELTYNNLNRNIFFLRNIATSDLPEAKEFFQWLVAAPLYRYLGEIAGIFKHQYFSESFFEKHDGAGMNFLRGNCLQVMFSTGRYTPKALQDYYVKHYEDMDSNVRMKTMLNMLLCNSKNYSAICALVDEVRNADDQQVYHKRMYSLIKELGIVCCFDSDLIYDFYAVDPAFVHEMTYYTINDIRGMLKTCEKWGAAYKPRDWQVKRYISYMKALLAFLRLRDPDRAVGYALLAVGSDDSKKLAREIRTLDDYMSREGPINPAIRFKLNKPDSLSGMSDLSYALDLYLNGDKKAASIEVAGVDEDDQ